MSNLNPSCHHRSPLPLILTLVEEGDSHHLLLKTHYLLDQGSQIPPQPSPGNRDLSIQAAVHRFGTCPWFLSLRMRVFETQHFLVQA